MKTVKSRLIYYILDVGIFNFATLSDNCYEEGGGFSLQFILLT